VRFFFAAKSSDAKLSWPMPAPSNQHNQGAMIDGLCGGSLSIVVARSIEL